MVEVEDELLDKDKTLRGSSREVPGSPMRPGFLWNRWRAEDHTLVVVVVVGYNRLGVLCLFRQASRQVMQDSKLDSKERREWI